MDELEQLVPELVPWAKQLLAQAVVPYEITSVYRSMRRQRRLYRLSQTDPEYPFPVAPPDCDCATHVRRISWDMISSAAELARLGRIWQSWGGIWGGARDPIHFQAGPRMVLQPMLVT